jgi:hypothetical protein
VGITYGFPPILTTALQMLFEIIEQSPSDAQATRLHEVQVLVQEFMGRARHLSLDLRSSRNTQLSQPHFGASRATICRPRPAMLVLAQRMHSPSNVMAAPGQPCPP